MANETPVMIFFSPLVTIIVSAYVKTDGGIETLKTPLGDLVAAMSKYLAAHSIDLTPEDLLAAAIGVGGIFNPPVSENADLTSAAYAQEWLESFVGYLMASESGFPINPAMVQAIQDLSPALAILHVAAKDKASGMEYLAEAAPSVIAAMPLA